MADLSAGGGLSRFAHLTGGIAAKAKAEDDDDKKDKDEAKADDSDDTDAKASDDEEDDDKKKDDDKKDDAKGKAKSKASASVVRLAERARCAAILEAAGPHSVALAAHLAFNTDADIGTASAMLSLVPASAAATTRAPGLAARMAAVPAITVGADGNAGDQPKSQSEEARALASSIIASARASGVIRK